MPYACHHFTVRVRCEITNTSAYFEDTEILKEGQRRLALAVELKRPFFLVVSSSLYSCSWTA